jgi:acetyl esterase/lipase
MEDAGFGNSEIDGNEERTRMKTSRLINLALAGLGATALGAIVVLVAIAAPTPVLAQNPQQEGASSENRPQTNLRTYVSDTVSEGWRQVFETLPDPTKTPRLPGPNDLEGWKKVHDGFEQGSLEVAEEAAKNLQVNVASKDLGGVPILEITPKGWVDNGRLLVYTHGGAYTLFSARSTLPSGALVANRTGLRVISVDYTNPPRARWSEVTDQVVRVFKALNGHGFAMKDLAIYGDSAGGGLAAGVVLKMRDEGMRMPAAVVLWSPWADITETGDTYVTLKEAEPNYLYERVLGPSADAYADPKDQKHPYVSPVYGDFKKGFPPTLIQGGTREIFLSNFVRLYQALDTTGQTVILDIYEGMPHVFQVKLATSPESKMALGKVDAFLKQHLGK